MAATAEPSATPQGNTGAVADTGQAGAAQGDVTTTQTQGDTQTTSQGQADGSKPDGASNAQQDGAQTKDGTTGDTSGDAKTEGEAGKDGGEKAPEGPKPDVKSAAEYDLGDGNELVKGFADTAFALGMTKAQAQGAVQWWGKLQENAQAKAVADAEKAALELQGEWKGDYDANMAVSNRAIDTFGSPELVKELKKTGFGRNPHMVRFVHNIAKQLSEDSYITGGVGGGNDNHRTLGGNPKFGFTDMKS